MKILLFTIEYPPFKGFINDHIFDPIVEQVVASFAEYSPLVFDAILIHPIHSHIDAQHPHSQP